MKYLITKTICLYCIFPIFPLLISIFLKILPAVPLKKSDFTTRSVDIGIFHRNPHGGFVIIITYISRIFHVLLNWRVVQDLSLRIEIYTFYT